MTRYLIWWNGTGAIVEINPRELTSGDWGQIYDAFLVQSRVRNPKDCWPSARRLDDYFSHSSIYWDEELAGPDGASFRLHQLPGNTPEQVRACKAHIRRSFDAVSISVNRVHTLIQFKMPELTHK